MSEYIFHNKIINRIVNNDIQNYIIYGDKGSGKRFIVDYLLKEKYNIKKYNIFNFITKINNNKYDINLYKSLYHYDIFINKDTSTYEKIIINFLKEFIYTINICNNYNIFIINGLINLNNLQLFICKCIDISIHKFIIITNNYGLIHNNLKSRCIPIRIPIPKIDNHLKLLPIPNNKKEIILKKYSYNLNIYFECLDLINNDNFEKILDNNKINILFNKLLKNIKLKRFNSLNQIKDIINDLLIFNEFNLIRDFYIFILKQNIFTNDDHKINITKEFSKIEALSKSGNDNIIYFENLIIYLKLLYFRL